MSRRFRALCSSRNFRVTERSGDAGEQTGARQGELRGDGESTRDRSDGYRW